MASRVMANAKKEQDLRVFLRWLEDVVEPWQAEWTRSILSEVPTYQLLAADEVRQHIGQHVEALLHCWRTGDWQPLRTFYAVLAERRVSERVRLKDVSRAVTVGHDLLIARIQSDGPPEAQRMIPRVTETFREGRYELIDSYQSASERRASEAKALVEATEAGAARTRAEWSLLDQVLSAMDVGILLMDRNLRVIWANRNMPPGLLKLDLPLVLGRPCREVMRSEFMDCDRCRLEAEITEKPSLQVIRKVVVDGESRDYLKVTRRFSGDAIADAYLMEIFLDVTAREEAQRSLARTRELVRNILDSSASGIVATDMQGRITLFSRGAERLFGFSEAEMLGQWVGHYYGEGPKEAARIMARLRTGGDVADYETSFRDKTGVFVPVRVTATFLRDENRAVLGTLGFCQDLRMEEALKQEVASRERYLLAILQGSMDGLITLDAQNRIASWNRGASAIFGVEPGTALGRHMMELLPIEGRRDLPSSTKLPAGTKRFEATLASPSGETLDLLVTRTEIRDPLTGEAGSSMVLKDVTELKRLQRELAEAEHLAELGRLAASVAHEIKNPIAGLRGAMEMMSGVHLREDPRFAIFQEALLQMRRLDSLVKDLLTFARPVAVTREPVPPHLLVESTLPFVQKGAEEASVVLEREVPDDLPLVMVDPQQMQQVIVNLVMNAVQAIEGGGRVTISASATGAEVALSVRDTGAGIKAEHRDNIFRPFFTTKHIGTGLGLSIVQRIVYAHGGRIAVDSKVGEGTVFTVCLPVAAGSD